MIVGRRTKLTPELRERFMRVISRGNSRRNACMAVGINPDTLYEWLRRANAEPDSIYSEFSDYLKKAEAGAERRAVGQIRAAMKDNWQAAAWFLERKFHETWGRKDKHEHSGPDGGPIESEIVGGMSRAEIRRTHIDRVTALLGGRMAGSDDAGGT